MHRKRGEFIARAEALRLTAAASVSIVGASGGGVAKW
jgi:hypothetical protein